ncbi:spindle pole body component 110-like [Nicotiana sylvestris]|uniref:spindle pole body component 110-like n=1 Tax=Nicotiana sylvestris TaxID=4096 RepID=UPI00388C4764
MKKNVEGVDVPKMRADCNAENLRKWEKNAKTKKCLVCGLGLDEYIRIQSYTTAKEIWDTLQMAYEGTPQVIRFRGTLLYSQYENFTMKEGDTIQEMYTMFTTLTNELKSLGRESKNIVTLKLDELIGNLTAYELRRQTKKMDAPKKERILALRITEGVDLEEGEMVMITKDFKKYLMRGKGPFTSGNYSKPRVPEKQTNEILQQESLYEDSEDEYGDEQALMTIGESDEESEVSVIHLKDKIKFLSKERLSEVLLDFINESEDINNEKKQFSKECVILKAKYQNLKLMASESDSKNAELKNQVLELDYTVLDHRSKNLKLKLGTCKKKVDHTQLTLEENLGKMKDKLYKRYEQIRVLKEDLSKVKHELDRTCKWNRSSDALSWLQEHHSRNKRGLGYETPAP